MLKSSIVGGIDYDNKYKKLYGTFVRLVIIFFSHHTLHMKYVELPSTLSFFPSVTATHAVDDDGSFVSTRTAKVAAYDSRRFCLVRDVDYANQTQ